MSAAYLLPEHHDGAISVVPETAKIVALSLQGDFDLTNTQALETQIQLALDDGNDLILDFNEATFVDSSVIHVLERAAHSARDKKATIVLQLAEGAIAERVLELTKNEHLLPRAHDRQEALRMIQQQASSERVAGQARRGTFPNAGPAQADPRLRAHSEGRSGRHRLHREIGIPQSSRISAFTKIVSPTERATDHKRQPGEHP